VVHEDAALLVINKPAGLVVHPAAGNWSGTLLNGLLYRDAALAQVPRAGIVHRLDKDTTGLMVVARTVQAQLDLVRQLQARTVQREYLALVWGALTVAGTVDAPLARDPRNPLRMAVARPESGKAAITHYTPLAQGRLQVQAKDLPVTLVQCKLATGRTHQIRVHLAHLGFPLVGDPLYGKKNLAEVFPRQALHAWQLGLQHPLTQVPCQWQRGLPTDMETLLKQADIAWPR
jgi:23S rRNA pseudouridine1911/1915/1917 synthase